MNFLVNLKIFSSIRHLAARISSVKIFQSTNGISQVKSSMSVVFLFFSFRWFSSASSFQPVVNRQIFAGNLLHAQTLRKEKYPREFFPEVKRTKLNDFDLIHSNFFLTIRQNGREKVLLKHVGQSTDCQLKKTHRYWFIFFFGFQYFRSSQRSFIPRRIEYFSGRTKSFVVQSMSSPRIDSHVVQFASRSSRQNGSVYHFWWFQFSTRCLSISSSEFINEEKETFSFNEFHCFLVSCWTTKWFDWQN